MISYAIRLINRILKPYQYKKMKGFDKLERYFKNKCGLEIGGPSEFFKERGFLPVYATMACLDGINFSSLTVWTGTIDKEQGFLIDGKCVGKQYILDAVDLTPIEKSTYDFVLSCNNIEHIANPLQAVEEWLSVLKPKGILVIVAPKKESNFDHNRKVVLFDHLISDYQNKIKESDLTHLEEIFALHDLRMDQAAGTIEQFRKRGLDNFENRCLHHHVFNLDILREIFEYFNLILIRCIKLCDDYVIIGQK